LTKLRTFAGLLFYSVGYPSSAGLVTVHAVTFNGCHFKMKDPYGGTLQATERSTPALANYSAEINPSARHPFETWIQFDCENNVNISDLSKLAGVGKQNGRWVIAFNGDAKALNTTLYTLHGKGWEGAGITQDQQDGDEDKRTRTFSFCLLHASRALCGTTDTVMYLAQPNESVLPQVIKLLESIEFIDAP